MICKICNKKVKPIPKGFRKPFEEQEYKCPECHYPIKKESHLFLILIIIFATLAIILSYNVMAYDVTATVNFNSQVGQIRSDFYGVNTYGIFGSNISWIDTDGDGILETLSNSTWHKEKLSEALIGSTRADMNLEFSSLGVNSFDTTSQNKNYENINKIKEQVYLSYQTNRTIYLIADYMPSWLNDTTRSLCTSARLTSCPPKSYDTWGQLVRNYVWNVTNQGEWASVVKIMVWNEYQSTFWLNNLTNTPFNATIRNQEYEKLVNATKFYIKLNWSNMDVGTGSLNLNALTYHPEFIKAYYFANISTISDFVEIHPYVALNFDTNTFFNQMNNFYLNCTQYNGKCNNIVIGEWTTDDNLIKNISANSSQYGNIIATGYSYWLNSFKISNLTSLLFRWSTAYKYSATNLYNSYPDKWGIVSEPQLDNQIYPPYNITKMFATNHKANNYVVTSSTNDSSVKIVASYDSSGQKYITITNTNSFAINQTISGLTTGYRLVDNSSQYNVSGTSIYIYDIPAYGVYTMYSFDEATTQDSGGLFYTSLLRLLAGVFTIFVLGIAVSMFYIHLKNNFKDLDAFDIIKYGVVILICVTLAGVLFDFIWGLI